MDRVILLRPGTTPTFGVVGIETPIDGIDIDQVALQNNMVRITLRNVPVSDELQGKHVLIRTDLQRMKEIQIPFRVVD
jgi:hypothetical protein